MKRRHATTYVIELLAVPLSRCRACDSIPTFSCCRPCVRPVTYQIPLSLRWLLKLHRLLLLPHWLLDEIAIAASVRWNLARLLGVATPPHSSSNTASLSLPVAEPPPHRPRISPRVLLRQFMAEQQYSQSDWLRNDLRGESCGDLWRE